MSLGGNGREEVPSWAIHEAAELREVGRLGAQLSTLAYGPTRLANARLPPPLSRVESSLATRDILASISSDICDESDF